VKRLVQTSRGWLQLDPSHLGRFGLGIRVTVFEDGDWSTAEESWNARWPGEYADFEEFLVDLAKLPPDEAARISEETLRQWRERGEEDEDRIDAREAIWFAGLTLALAGLGAVALVGAIVVALWWLI
jgi:hypothetical protein